MTQHCPTQEIDELYHDLESKAAIDVDATVRIIEALERVLAGSPANPPAGGELLSPGSLPGKSPAELTRQMTRLRAAFGHSLNARKIIELRDSLYRYQSL